MSKTILVQGAGGGGGNNLIRELKKVKDISLSILGSNCLKHAVAKSNADETFLLPASNNPDYLNQLNNLIKQKKIDLIIPNSDREVGAVSELRESIKTKTFLPNQETVKICQDKFLFYTFLQKHNVRTPPFVNISSINDIESAMNHLGKNSAGKYWIRPTKGSGSCGATWVTNSDQAKKWISLWCELRGFKENNFMVSEFLPGYDYNFQSIWNNGRLLTATLCERLSYYGGRNRLSGMSSTPEIAISKKDLPCFHFILKLINLLPGKPHGSYNMDLKGNGDNTMYPTEINIGRFPMIITLHDNIGPVMHSEAYIKSALNFPVETMKEEDYQEDFLLIRELDTEPLVVHKSRLPE